ncbi:hypothetical protein vseg_004636 [Gypsophila vaccaria]
MEPTQPQNQPATTAASRAEAERLLGVASKLLQTRDLSGAREFAQLAQETDPFLEGSEQILAITDVLLASEKPTPKRVNNRREMDYYGILQSPRDTVDNNPDLLRKNYRRLALLLHPDKNPLPLASAAFKLVSDSWAFLSDPSKRTPYDHQLSLFEKVHLRHPPSPSPPPHHTPHPAGDKLPVRRTAPAPAPGKSFWTACPYCYVMYEYGKEVEEYCVRCQNCDRAFHAAAIPSLPPLVPGKEAYYCCWGFFPLGFSVDTGADGGGGGSKGKKVDSNANNKTNAASNNGENENGTGGFPNWMPGMFTTPVAGGVQGEGVGTVNRNNVPNMNMNVNAGGAAGATVVDFSGGSGGGSAGGFRNAVPGATAPGAKKRGRPRKNPVGV